MVSCETKFFFRILKGDGKADAVSPSRGDEGLGPAYLVNGIDDSGSIFPPELQGNFCIPFVIDECCYLLLICGFEILRSEVLPLMEDILLCHKDGLLTMGG